MSTEEKEEIVLRKKKASQQSNFDYERHFLTMGYDFVVGIDEVGRGPLAGPVVAGACAPKEKTINVLNGHPMSKLIRDSKTLSEKQREEVFDFICENFYIGIGLCDHHTIDRVNILEATYLAMKSAISQLTRSINQESRVMPEKARPHNSKFIILVDGNKKIPNISLEQKAIVGGDKIVKSISAASIIAKVTRDRLMHKADKIYPQYGFSQHKGYGTKKHLDALKNCGPCEIHRRSFAPVGRREVDFGKIG